MLKINSKRFLVAVFGAAFLGFSLRDMYHAYYVVQSYNAFIIGYQIMTFSVMILIYSLFLDD